MSEWRPVEVFADFVKIVGELEVVQPDRLSDSVNRVGGYLQLRKARTEPLSVNYPVISREEPATTLAKASATLICPLGEPREGTIAMWREKVSKPATINTQLFSLVCDVHLEKRGTLEDHLERNPGDFLPVTNISALWVAAIGN